MKTRFFILAGFWAAVFLPPGLPALAQDTKHAPFLTSPLSIPDGTLALSDAIAMAMEKSPVLGASQSREEAAAADRKGAGALTNPEISVEAENIYGDGPYEGFESAEITYGVSQLMEIPGKRYNRIKVADAEKNKSHFDRDAAQLDLIRSVTIAYAEMVAAQEDVSILEDEYTLASEVSTSVSAKVEAGKEPPIQKNKADIERTASEIALQRARRVLVTKTQALTALIGGKAEAFRVNAESLPAIQAPEPLETYRALLAETPDMKKFEAGIAQSRSAIALEKINALPDPTFNVGVKDLRADDRQAFVAGISVPIPVFNANQAKIERAGHELNIAMLERYSGQLSLEAIVTEIHGNLESAYAEISALQAQVLPGAEEAFRVAREGYEAGKFEYLEVLDAQRTLFQSRHQLNKSVLDYHSQRAFLERITAIHDLKHDHKGPQQ